MTGLPYFKFYPRDWISGTRTLSVRARGVYVDLLATMYDHGAPLKHDERWLCKLLGFRDARQLRPLIDELVQQGKIEIADGKIRNGRAMDEIDAAHQRIAEGGKGGRPKRTPENVGEGVKQVPAGDQRPSRYPNKQGELLGKQTLNENPPEPEPERKNNGASSVDLPASLINKFFDKFWNIYPPRRPHSNPRKPALQKFEAALKRGIPAADIIRGAENYAAYVERERTDPKYVTQAMTWLRQERWTEYQSAVPATKAKGDWL